MVISRAISIITVRQTYLEMLSPIQLINGDHRRPKGTSGGHKVSASRAVQASDIYAYIYTVEPAITATLYNGHLPIAGTNEQSRPKFHDIEPVYSVTCSTRPAATRL